MIDRIENWRQMSLVAINCSSSTTTPDEDILTTKGIFIYLHSLVCPIFVILLLILYLGPDSFKDRPSMVPDFPLVPASKGFCLSLDKSLEAFKAAVKAANLWCLIVIGCLQYADNLSIQFLRIMDIIIVNILFCAVLTIKEESQLKKNKTQWIEILDHENNMIAKWLDSDRIRIQSNSKRLEMEIKMIPKWLDSKMIGSEKR